MRKISEGDLVTDGEGVTGRVLEVRYVPSPGQGVPNREEFYVEWLPPRALELVVNEDALPESSGMRYRS